MERSTIAKDSKYSCYYQEGPENDPVATFTVAIVPNSPKYLESVRAALEPLAGHDAIVEVGSNGICSEGAQPGRVGTDLSLQVGNRGLGFVFAGPKPGLPCNRLIALVHEANPGLP